MGSSYNAHNVSSRVVELVFSAGDSLREEAIKRVFTRANSSINLNQLPASRRDLRRQIEREQGIADERVKLISPIELFGQEDAAKQRGLEPSQQKQASFTNVLANLPVILIHPSRINIRRFPRLIKRVVDDSLIVASR
jgi:hypothetical protein